jgi:hypothetical protein
VLYALIYHQFPEFLLLETIKKTALISLLDVQHTLVAGLLIYTTFKIYGANLRKVGFTT